MGVLQDNLVLSTGLIMWIGHRKVIRKLTFRALAQSLRQRANTRNGGFPISLRWPIHIINPVGETKLSFILFWWWLRSTVDLSMYDLPILASSVVMACTSAVAYKSTSLFVIGRASVCTRIRRSPAKYSETWLKIMNYYWPRSRAVLKLRTEFFPFDLRWDFESEDDYQS